jgi:DNA polymerase III subunit epsilon
MIKRIEMSFVEWCASVVNSDEYVIIDTETTGLKRHDQIIELSIVAASGQVLYDKLLQPSCSISEGAMNAHHISEAMVAQARCFKEEWSEIEAAIAGRACITYNAEFDFRMLRQSAIAHNVDLPEFDWYCAMREYARFWDAPGREGTWLGSKRLSSNSAPFQKLEVACMQQSVAFVQEHRALGDTLATLSLIKKIAEQGENAPTYSTREKDWWDIEEALEG